MGASLSVGAALAMRSSLHRTLAAACLLTGPISAAQALEAGLVTLDTPRGARQTLILIKPDKPPVASVVLFAGGHGALGLTGPQAMAWGAGNFLVRTRETFAKEGFLVAVVDAPSDQRQGMAATFRMSREHAADVGAVVARLRKEADVPVWLVGTSMGTFSAAGAQINGAGADGLVLTSTITRAKPQWKIAGSHAHGVASLRLEAVKVPTFILSHAKDGCDITPAADTPKLQRRLTNARKVEVRQLTGGSPPQSNPCEAKSEHGFLGIEGQAVGAVAGFIRANVGAAR